MDSDLAIQSENVLHSESFDNSSSKGGSILSIPELSSDQSEHDVNLSVPDEPASDSNHVESPEFNNNNYTNTSETLELNIFQRTTDNVICVLVSFPTHASIRSIYGLSVEYNTVPVKYQIASAYGSQSGTYFNMTTQFLPGDYCFGLAFESKEQADSVILIKADVCMEPIGNLMMSQIIFGLYRNLGFEPSHVLNYPIKTAKAGIPFYRKTRNEINQLAATVKSTHSNEQVLFQIGAVEERLTSLLESKLNAVEERVNCIPRINDVTEERIIGSVEHKFNVLGEQVLSMSQSHDSSSALRSLHESILEINNKVCELQNVFNRLANIEKQIAYVSNRRSDDSEKGSNAMPSITVSDISRIVGERDLYLNKLTEAENHIEYLEGELEEVEKQKQNNTRNPFNRHHEWS